MRISDLETGDENVALMTIVHPGTREPLVNSDNKPMTLSMVGIDSPRMLEAARRINAKALMKRSGSVGSEGEAMKTVKEQERREIQLVASAVVTWHVSLDEDNTQFSFEKCCDAFLRFPWLFNQANVFLADRANFLKASSET